MKRTCNLFNAVLNFFWRESREIRKWKKGKEESSPLTLGKDIFLMGIRSAGHFPSALLKPELWWCSMCDFNTAFILARLSLFCVCAHGYFVGFSWGEGQFVGRWWKQQVLGCTSTDFGVAWKRKKSSATKGYKGLEMKGRGEWRKNNFALSTLKSFWAQLKCQQGSLAAVGS